MTRKEIEQQVGDILHKTFEIPYEDIKPETRLQEDLDLDSIDAVDLIVKLQAHTDRKIDPESFKQVRTIDDVITVIYRLVSESPADK